MGMGPFGNFSGSTGASGGGGGGFNWMGAFMQALPMLTGGGQQQQVQPAPPPQTPPPTRVGPPELASSGDKLGEKVTPSLGERVAGRTKRFAENTDDLFSSDSKVLGLGLLNQADPRLMYAAIIANGLLGKQDGQ